MVSFYSRFHSLDKAEDDRNARRKVLNMIRDYRDKEYPQDYSNAENQVMMVSKMENDSSVLPAVMPTKIKGASKTEYPLTASQYVDYQKKYEELYWKYAEAELKGKRQFDTMAKSLKEVKDRASAEATSWMMNYLSYEENDNRLTFDQQLAKAKEDDGKVSKAEVRDILDVMIDAGLTNTEATDFYRSTFEDKKFDSWTGSGGDSMQFIAVLAANEQGNQDGVADYLNRSGLSREDQLDLWLAMGWQKSSFDKKVK